MMRKQTGKIYCREPSKSPDKVFQKPQNSQVEDQRTIRKQSLPSLSLIVSKNSKSSKENLRSNKNQTSWHQSFNSQTSRQFSSIHESSLSNLDQSNCLAESELKPANEISISLNSSSHFADSLAIYQNPILKNNQIVKKLSHLNNIFKQIKSLRVEKLNRQIITQINQAQRDLIEIQRQILRTC